MTRFLGRGRWALWVGLGAGLAVCLFARRADGQHASRRSRRQAWITDFRPGPNGRFDPDTLVDEASADSFPASDPPATMGSVIPGAPRRS